MPIGEDAMFIDRFDNDENEIEITPEELQRMVEEATEVDIDLDEFAQRMLELDAERLFEEERQKDIRRYYEAMRDAMLKKEFHRAFTNAKQLKPLAYMLYREEIDECYETCAVNGVEEALIFMADKYTVHGSIPINPKAFPYLKALSDRGYIASFRWLAECYHNGIGCEKDLTKARELYFEGMIFGYSEYCEKQYAAMPRDSKDICGNELLSNIRALLAEKKCDPRYARIRIAEMIIDGEIREYGPEAAYAILKKVDWPIEGISFYRLGECLVHGIGTVADPIVAIPVLEWALDELKYIIEDIEDPDTREFISSTFHTEKDYFEAYEATKDLIEEAKDAKDRLDEYKIMMSHDGEADEDTIREEWEKREVLHIKRHIKRRQIMPRE